MLEVNKVDIKPIKTDADYRAALKEIGMLMTAEPDTPEGEKLDVLVTLVEAYEQKHYPLDLTDVKHLRLKALAQHRHVSVNKLVEELSTQALAEFDSEVRFRALAAMGDTDKGLKLLEKLDAHFTKG